MENGVARRLRDRVRDADKELGKPNEDPDRQAEKLAEKVRELRDEIEKLEAEGELSQGLADELRTRLAAVTGAG